MIRQIWNKIIKYFTINTDCYASNKDLANLFKKFNGCSVYVTDKRSRLIPESELKRVLSLNLFSLRKWRKEVHDCDNFAYALKGLFAELYGDFAFGIVFVNSKKMGKHALNCFVDEFMKFHFIEPQNNNIFKPDECDYKPYLIVV